MHKMLFDLPTRLETSRLIIRKYEKHDGVALYRLLEKNDNREYLKDHVTEASTITTEEEAEIRVRELNADWVARNRFVMGIWLKKPDVYVGQIWIEPKKWEVPSFELGWFLEKSHQGQGIATEAAEAAIHFLFNHLKAHKIIVLTRDDNPESYKLAERCGFTKEGHFRDHGMKNGKRFGLFCYGMLKNEFKAKNE
ncbi:MAG: GNAT family N-acetyltransferase [Candidatus Hodarchaeales archaeon]|jgi:RimJ/RimL family protein N-acetyltransferase